eukprot:5051019-Amphidinium_carterae.3
MCFADDLTSPLLIRTCGSSLSWLAIKIILAYIVAGLRDLRDYVSETKCGSLTRALCETKHGFHFKVTYVCFSTGAFSCMASTTMVDVVTAGTDMSPSCVTKQLVGA